MIMNHAFHSQLNTLLKLHNCSLISFTALNCSNRGIKYLKGWSSNTSSMGWCNALELRLSCTKPCCEIQIPHLHRKLSIDFTWSIKDYTNLVILLYMPTCMWLYNDISGLLSFGWWIANIYTWTNICRHCHFSRAYSCTDYHWIAVYSRRISLWNA